MAKRAGCRRAYEDTICKHLIDFFCVDPFETDPSGKKIAIEMPHLIDFLEKYGITPNQFDNWITNKNRKKYGPIQDAWEKCKLYREKCLVNNALKGRYNTLFSMFYMKNIFGWADKQTQTIEAGDSWVKLVKRASSNRLKEAKPAYLALNSAKTIEEYS